MLTASRIEARRTAALGTVTALAIVIGLAGFVAAPVALAIAAERPINEHALVLAPGTTDNH